MANETTRTASGTHKDTALRRFLDRSHFPRLTRRGREARDMRLIGFIIEGEVERVMRLFTNQQDVYNRVEHQQTPTGERMSTAYSIFRDSTYEGNVVNKLAQARVTRLENGVSYTWFDNSGKREELEQLQEQDQVRIAVTRYQDGSFSLSGSIGKGEDVKPLSEMTDTEQHDLLKKLWNANLPKSEKA